MGIKNVFEKNMAEYLANLKKKTYPGTRSTQGTKQTHMKTYHN